jgi:predicted MFS family arabinose efflux permease
MGLSRPLIILLAVAVGVIAANLYYAQPLVAMISHALGLAPEAAGLVVTLTQVGYGLGVLLIVPLGDIAESRRLVMTMMAVAILGLLGLAFVTQLIPYFIAAFATGVGASTVQIIVPYAAHFTPKEKRGQVVGNLMSGLMIGIMLSRPIAGLLTDAFSWHAVFILSAFLMTLLALALYRVLPPRPPTNKDLHYFKLLNSMVHLFLRTEVLRRRAIYQACLFGAFCLFWTASPLLLAGSEFHLSQSAIAIFALVGVSGAISAPFAGKAADRGWTRGATALAMIASSCSFLISHFFHSGSSGALAALVVSAILLDAGITANLVLGQRAIFSLEPEFHGRLNGLYIATIFIGGALGSALGAWAYARGGWDLTSWVGLLMPALAFAYFVTDRKTQTPVK